MDDIGNVVLVGEGSRTPTQSAFMALKFNGSSGNLMWSQLYYETDPILGEVSGPAKGVVIGPGGFIYACGAIEVFNEYYDALAVRISPTTGAVVNTATYGLPTANSQIAEDIAWDGAGGLYVTGSTADNELPLSSVGSDLLLAKYNGALGTVWTRTFDAHGMADYGRSIACRRSLNSVYIMGNTTGTDPSVGQPRLEVAVLRINSILGTQVWRKTKMERDNFPTQSELRKGEMVLDRLGYLSLVAWSYPGWVRVYKYASTNGALSWSREFEGQNYNLIADVSGNVIIAGERIAKYGANGHKRWDNAEPTAACTVSSTGVVYSAGAQAGDMRVIRWNQTAYVLTFTPDPPLGGTIITGTVRSTLPAPVGGLTFTFGLLWEYFGLAVPAPVTIPAGKTFVNFPMHLPAAGGVDFALTAYHDGAGASTTIVLLPPSLKSLTVAPTTIKGGGIAIGTMKTDSILSYGFTFYPTSNSPFCTVGSGIIYSNSATSKPFNVRTLPVTAVTPVTLSLTWPGVTKTAMLTITP